MVVLGKKGKRYSPRFQFQVVLEVLKGDRDAVKIARAHDLHPTTVSRWKREFLENGAAVFGKDTTAGLREEDQGDGAAAGAQGGRDCPPAEFYGRQLVTAEKVEIVEQNAGTYGLNVTLDAIGLPKSTWY